MSIAWNNKPTSEMITKTLFIPACMLVTLIEYLPYTEASLRECHISEGTWDKAPSSLSNIITNAKIVNKKLSNPCSNVDLLEGSIFWIHYNFSPIEYYFKAKAPCGCIVLNLKK